MISLTLSIVFLPIMDSFKFDWLDPVIGALNLIKKRKKKKKNLKYQV